MHSRSRKTEATNTQAALKAEERFFGTCSEPVEGVA
jgi:hypothetical protein